MLPRGLSSDGKDGAVFRFLSKKREPFGVNLFLRDNGLPTHTLLNGGKVHVPDKQRGDEDLVELFFDSLHKDFKQGTMLPIVSVRTVVFPFYADFDFKVEVAELSPSFVLRLSSVLNSQAQKFFPSDRPPLKLIVCDKSGDAKQIQGASSAMAEAIGVPSVLYKHGLHLHWPEVLVKHESALQMRASMLSALERESWVSDLGSQPLAWDSIFDECVYGSAEKAASSLRMVGAPKASLCSSCKNGKERPRCATCASRGFEIDPSHYKMCVALRGDEEDSSLTQKLTSNFYSLLKETNVRGDPERTTISEGWSVYPGCPPVRSSGKGKKRKTPCDAERVEKKFTSKPEIQDAEKEKVMRRLLVKHSDKYSNANFRILFDEKHTYKVPLRGEGAQFCLNKKGDGYHRSQNVYMELLPSDLSRNEYVSRMRCFCRCKTYEGRNGTLCSEFRSKNFLLTSDDVSVLYNKGTSAKQQRERALLLWKSL